MKTEQRVIKFRCWDTENKRMVYPDGVFHFIANGKLFKLDPLIREDRYFDMGLDVKIMQFTGLVDKERNDVYEGDFFLIDGVALIVIFEDGKYCFDNTGGSYGRDFLGQDRVGRLTRSGNIYQHPHLLPSTTTI